MIYLLAKIIIIMFNWRYGPIRRVEKRKEKKVERRRRRGGGGPLVGFRFSFLSFLLLSIYLVSLPMNYFFLTYFCAGPSLLMQSKLSSDPEAKAAKRLRSAKTSANGGAVNNARRI